MGSARDTHGGILPKIDAQRTGGPWGGYESKGRHAEAGTEGLDQGTLEEQDLSEGERSYNLDRWKEDF